MAKARYLQVEGEATTTATVTTVSNPSTNHTYYSVMDTRYRCGTCGEIYEYDSRYRISCCVLHAPGDCCHLGEQLVPEEPVENWYPLEPLPGGSENDTN